MPRALVTPPIEARSSLLRRVLLAVACFCAPLSQAETVGWVVNSDSQAATGFDALHRVVLETGQATRIATSTIEAGTGNDGASPQFLGLPFLDVEGLALAPDGSLYGADDFSKTLIRINTSSGLASVAAATRGNLRLSDTPHDFGLSFGCDGVLYMSSDQRKTLYTVSLSSGEASRIGNDGNLGFAITALAVLDGQMYGLGAEGDEGLYRVDIETGTASLIAHFPEPYRYMDAGMSVDTQGRLWAILDRTETLGGNATSLIVRIDPHSGQINTIAETIPGIESLAIAPPVCRSLGTPAVPVPVGGQFGWWLGGALLALLGGLQLRRRGV